LGSTRPTKSRMKQRQSLAQRPRRNASEFFVTSRERG
jgi:hypothetical protein